MKEATGELNMTVVTVVAIAAVAAFFYAVIWPSVKTNITNSTKCANAVCTGTCTTQNGRKVCNTCRDASKPTETPFTCTYKE